ncbi:MAG: hypothetical protein R2764_23090 [Bacteroidales bacterium]
MGDLNYNYGTEENKYLYQGKELQEEHKEWLTTSNGIITGYMEFLSLQVSHSSSF